MNDFDLTMKGLLNRYLKKNPDFIPSKLGHITVEMVECVVETEQNLFPNPISVRLINEHGASTMDAFMFEN